MLAPEKKQRLKLRITTTAEWKMRAGHPWLFSDSISQQNRPGQLGEFAVLYDRHDNFLGIGLYDPDSPIRVRMLLRGKPQPIDSSWWRAHLIETCDRRRPWFDAQTTGYRWIHGESDGWPGLVLDRYGDTLVIKLYTAAWLPRLEEISLLILEHLQPERLVLRLSRNIQSRAAEYERADGQILHGPPLNEPVIFLETGLRFEAEVVRGQKTGFFLDQRENRRAVQALAAGRDVLNAFSFSGGFSLYAAQGGAQSTLDLDISSHALASAERNFALNQDHATVARCRHEAAQGDTFEWLDRNTDRHFDLVILDPPSMARREPERERAIQAYGRLARGGISRLRPGGVLVASSCSAHVSKLEFFGIVRQAARAARRPFEELQTTGHPPDHAANFPEGEYLKTIFLHFM